MNNMEYLLENADAPIRYILTKDSSLIPDVLANNEVSHWLNRMKEWAEQYAWCGIGGNKYGDVHGSDDRRYINIIGKCFILGMNNDIPSFDHTMQIYLNALNKQIKKTFDGDPAFWKMYEYRDYETFIAAYYPLMGYHGEGSVHYIAEKRINYVYEFARQKRYDIHLKEANYLGVKKEWVPYIVDPSLYRDGNIMLAQLEDYILYAGMYDHVGEDERQKIETIVEWIFDDKYADIPWGYYYYCPTDPKYKAKQINNKLVLANLIENPQNKGNHFGLLFICFILSHFKASRKSKWFTDAINYLEQYKTKEGRYKFPTSLITDKPDMHAWAGHLNVGENKKTKNYHEIISTFWMERILANLD